MNKKRPSVVFGPNSFHLWFILFSLICFAGSCEDALVENSSYSSLEGVVLEDSSGVAITGASVTTNPATEAVITDENGEFTLNDVPTGEYSISVRKQGYERTNVNVYLREDRAIQATILMRPQEEGESEEEASIEITNWWNNSREDGVYVHIEYRIVNTGGSTISEYDIDFRIENDQGEFFHSEKGTDLQPGRSRIGEFEKFVRDEEAVQVEVFDYWLGRFEGE